MEEIRDAEYYESIIDYRLSISETLRLVHSKEVLGDVFLLHRTGVVYRYRL